MNMSTSIDRSKVSPTLLRCVWKLNRTSAISDYQSIDKDIYPSNEIQIYTWPDATLKEISELLRETIEPFRERFTSLLFNHITFDNNVSSNKYEKISLCLKRLTIK